MSNDVRVRVTADTSQLRRGMEEAAGAVKGLQQNMGRAQGAASLFGGAIEALGGTSNATGKALGAMLGGFAGGGLVGLAIGGVTALVGALKSASEEAKKANEDWAKHVDTLAKGTEALRDKLLALRGMDPELHKMQVELVEMTRALGRRDDAADLEKWDAQKKRLDELNAKIRERQAAIRAVSEEEKKQADAKEATKAATKAEADRVAAVKAAARERAETEKKATADFLERVKMESDAVLSAIEKEEKAREKRAKDGQAALDARARRYEKAQEDAARTEKEMAAESAQTAQTIGNAFADAFAGIASGSQTVQQALAGVAAAVLKTTIDMITKSIQAKALDAAAGAASSQSSVPIVGPILATAAFAAMEAFILGSLSRMPGREHGGAAYANRPIVVGERRPEVFVPETNGTVHPSTAGFGGGGAVNVTIRALDGADAYATFRRNERDIARAQERARRLGRA